MGWWKQDEMTPIIDKELGLAGYGRSGRWEVGLHERVDVLADEIYIQIVSPYLTFQLTAPSLAAVTEVGAFYERTIGTSVFVSHHVGTFMGHTVECRNGDEHPDRFFMAVVDKDGGEDLLLFPFGTEWT